MHKLNQIFLHPTSIVQFGVPKILRDVKEEHFENMKTKLRESSNYAYEKLKDIKGLEPIKASAAMYMMVRIHLEEFDDIADDLDFCKKLLNEECVLVFPARCFFSKDGFRVVICQSFANIDEFASRLTDFCNAHRKRR